MHDINRLKDSVSDPSCEGDWVPHPSRTLRRVGFHAAEVPSRLGSPCHPERGLVFAPQAQRPTAVEGSLPVTSYPQRIPKSSRKPGVLPTLASSRKRLPHPSRFSKGGHHEPDVTIAFRKLLHSMFIPPPCAQQERGVRVKRCEKAEF
jgi:hypothetical protein